MPKTIDWNEAVEIEKITIVLGEVLKNKNLNDPIWQDAYIRAMQNLESAMGHQLTAWRFTQSKPR